KSLLRKLEENSTALQSCLVVHQSYDPSTTYINGPSLSNNSVLGNGDSTPDGSHHLEMSGTGSSGNCALDEARLRL
ncbi:hypothetical protein Gorai_017930, partial [Gossypium raimondii]|nr:hypothetical protein [Gossypium raimondii]